MGRSRSFASTTYDPKRPIQTRFPYGSPAERVNLAADGNSPDHYAKGTPSHIVANATIVLRPLVGVWFQVHYPPLGRGSSHLSVALLSSLSVVREYLALRDGPRGFSRGST
jgi:hypothetical protein